MAELRLLLYALCCYSILAQCRGHTSDSAAQPRLARKLQQAAASPQASAAMSPEGSLGDPEVYNLYSASSEGGFILVGLPSDLKCVSRSG